MTERSGMPEIYDVLGIGFGPSNLGLAVAIREHNASVPAEQRLRCAFLERQERFGWHRGMLLEDATMQISFLKDLVTQRNPASRYSFLSYLHARDRLSDFINYGSSFPTRIEFHDYLEWVAAGFTDVVRYGSEVDGVRPVRSDDGVVRHLEVHARSADGRDRVLRAANVALATGLSPSLPTGVNPGPRTWHNGELLARIAGLRGAPARFAVVGAGQSAAETVDYLHRTFPAAEISAVFARYGYSPADDSSFANRIFDPDAVDAFYTAPDPVKDMIMGYHANTNYSVVDPSLIDGLYRRHYHERVSGRERLRFHNVSRVADVVELEDRVEIAVESLVDGARQVVDADVLVYATGYRPSDPLTLMAPELASACLLDRSGRLRMLRDYRIATGHVDGAPVSAGIYVQGPTEHTHGISSTLLSNVAVRTGEIVESLCADRDATELGMHELEYPA